MESNLLQKNVKDMKGEDVLHIFCEALKLSSVTSSNPNGKMNLGDACQMIGRGAHTIKRYIKDGVLINYGINLKDDQILVDKHELIDAHKAQGDEMLKARLRETINAKLNQSKVA